MGDDQWGIKLSAGAGYMVELPGGKDEIIDRFFLGGDNLRGFQTGGAGPHDANTGDPLGGRFLWTEFAGTAFPAAWRAQGYRVDRADVRRCGRADPGLVPKRHLLGLPGRFRSRHSGAPRIGAGVGISWRTQFGLINVDLAPFVIKQPHDQTQIFRFGFGTRF